MMHPRAAIVDRMEDLTVHERKNLSALLHDILNTAYDSAEGYHTAATAVRNPELSEFFESCATDRREAISDLRKLLRDLGEEAGPRASLGGELHRALIAFRGAVERGDASAILAECERGEHNALRHYEHALEQKMPMQVASVLLDQASRVRSAHAAYERMRHPW